MAKRVNETSFQKEVLEAGRPVLVEFYSDGCLGCKQFSPVLGELEDTYEERIKIVKVNAMFSRELARTYAVKDFPTILFFNHGIQTGRLDGIVPRMELEAAIRSCIAG